MQRGSSLRSHHIGERRGSWFASASAASTQLSSEFDQSQKQSAALAEDASDNSTRAARAEERFLIRANPSPQSTPRMGGRKKGRSQHDDKIPAAGHKKTTGPTEGAAWRGRLEGEAAMRNGCGKVGEERVQVW